MDKKAFDFNVFVCRHGKSEMNAENYDGTPDWKIPLVEEGIEQAQKAGWFLYHYFGQLGLSMLNSRAWSSPHLRTMQTMEAICGFLPFKKIYTDPRLVEKQFGQFQWNPYEEWKDIDRKAFEHYDRCQETKSSIFAQMPLGESQWQVFIRTYAFLRTIARDRDERGICNVVISTHGVPVRTITQGLMHYDLEWLENEPNPGNCWIRHIKGVEVDKQIIDKYGEPKMIKTYQYTDLGYVFKGS